ncbi:MAG TPA: TonB-dependent receptor plug domain-containing protein, partial [Azonexus sp.]|nr:TonB-dependent receptor plug domain-containing protein [Azonexus sp.]
MIVTQHSGDGKANQYFLRGFNLDHGSDFASHVNGMPVNVSSHAHGQGYMDLNFLIPELIGSAKYRKGVYAVEDGDFTTTGSARIDYARRLDSSLADFSLGQHNYRRLLVAGSREVNGLQLIGGVEVTGNDGPWDQPEKLGKTSAVLRLSSGNAANGFALTAMAYAARWLATEHVPERAIASGEIGRYGSLSPNDGGRTHRYSLSAEWGKTDASGAGKASVYLVDYGLNLFSAPSTWDNGGEATAIWRSPSPASRKPTRATAAAMCRTPSRSPPRSALPVTAAAAGSAACACATSAPTRRRKPTSKNPAP